MGSRSRKRGRTAPPPPAQRRPRLRGEAADEAARQQLPQLQPGERPPALIAASAVAVALGTANVVLLAVGADVGGQEPSAGGAVIFAVLMFAAAVGMWQLRYWAVLGFQALLAITILIAALSLAVASNVVAVVLCLVIIVPGGWLFWKLVRVMARIQMPERRPPRGA